MDPAKPRYRALADAIEYGIRNGDLREGDRLPTHRDLSDALGVTVGTVTRGYAEAAKRGLVRGETGRGTFVGPAGSDGLPLLVTEEKPDLADLSFTGPMHGIEPDLAQTLAELARKRDVNSLLRYYPARGRTRDRRAGVEWLKRYGIETTEENVLVTAGGQHALSVILMGVFRPGDHIAVDPVTYPLFRSLARRHSITLIPVANDEHGMVPSELEAACRSKAIRGVYLMPAFHNPLTRAVPDYRRNELIDSARRFGLKIIVDDAYALSVENTGTAMAAMAPDITFSIGSVSKGVAGGLRIAYVYSPTEYLQLLERAVADSIWTASPLTAEIAAHWIENGTADRTVRRKQEEARIRNTMAGEVLSDFSFLSRPTGFYIWLTLPEPWRSGEFASEAAARGVPILSDEVFLVGRTPSFHAVRVALGNTPNRERLHRALTTVRDIALSRG